MHFIGTDLDLKGLSGGTDQSRVQRLIHVCLGHCNIILETSRNRFIHLMDRSQHRVTVPDRADNDTDSKQIIYLFERFFLIEHLSVNTEEMLYTTVNHTLNTGLMNMAPDFYGDLLYIVFTFTLALLNLGDEIVVDIRIKILE